MAAIKLGISKDIEEAEATAKSIRPIIDIKPLQKDALKKLYPNAVDT
jgi:hypothetical protein